jgi:hypothetical protein
MQVRLSEMATASNHFGEPSKEGFNDPKEMRSECSGTGYMSATFQR